MRDLKTLLLHTDNDTVWYSYAGSVSSIAGDQAIDHLLRYFAGKVRRVLLFGIAANAAVVCALYRHEKLQNFCRLRNPRYLPVTHTHAPELALYALGHYSWKTSSGALFQPITQETYRHYNLCVSLSRKQDIVENYLQHPCYKALSRLKNVSTEGCARLLSLIDDPRWFHSLHRPNRVQTLCSFLRISVKNLQDLLLKQGKGLSADSAMRLHIVLSAIGFDFNTQNVDFNKLYKACKKFITYLWLQWLSVFCPKLLFCPSVFFKEEPALQSYLNSDYSFLYSCGIF